MLENREDLFVGQFPGCLVFADRTEYEYGDYKDLARVSHAGNIKYFVIPGSLPEWVRRIIEEQAEKKKLECMKNAELEIKCRPDYFYAKMLDSLPGKAFREWVDGKKPGMTMEECCRGLLPVYMAWN